MPVTSKTAEQLNCEAVRVFHALPLMVLALGALVAGVYLVVGDSLYLLVGAVVAVFVFQTMTIRFAQRHRAISRCTRCENLHGAGIVTRFFVWYCHRRIWDNKAAMLIAAIGIVVSVVYVAIGKPHAVAPFMAGYGVFLVQFALLLRSVSVHRGNEPCQLCVAGDVTHPYGKISASELND